MDQRSELIEAAIAEAMTWLGTPFINGAPLKHRASDCFSYIEKSWRIADPDFAGVHRPPGHQRKKATPEYLKQMHELLVSVNFELVEVEDWTELKRGDWCFFQWNPRTLQTAFYLGDRKVLASLLGGGVQELVLPDRLLARLRYVYRKR